MGKEPVRPTTLRGSKGTGVSTNPSELEEDNVGKSPVEEQEVTTGFIFDMNEWTTVKEFLVWRIFQDNASLVVYRDKQGYCYATSQVKGLGFLVNHSLLYEEQPEKVGQI